MINTQQQRTWTEAECKEALEINEVVSRLKNNTDFISFKKFYIDKQRNDLVKVLNTNSLGSPARQISIEAIIGLNNLEEFLDVAVEENAKTAKMYLKELKENKK